MQSHSLRSKKVQAVLLIRDGQPAAAKNLLEEIVQSDRHDADTWYMLASVNHRLGISWWVELLEKRFRKTMPDVADRIVFLPPRDSPGFVNLLAVCDVMLDTIHFNGMNTSLEAFSVGTPIVTLPTEFQRGRHTAGMYRKMGFTECIAADRNDYVRIAVKLGTEEDYRRHAKDEILRRNEVLFEDMRVVREFERCFLETVAHSG